MVDARHQVLGRLGSQVATLLRGKDQVSFAPHVVGTARVVVINARHVRVTGNKLKQMGYYHHSGYPGGLKRTSLRVMLKRRPCYVIEHAVRLMLPKNRLGRHQMRHLFVYPDAAHPHAAQAPQVYALYRSDGNAG